MWRGFVNCQNCNTIIENGYALCTACELRFAGTLLQLARDVTPLHDSLDATLHPGGHAPVRIQTATPPTPIRLDVLDLIDMLDSTARELWRCLDGIDALDWRRDPRTEDLKATLIKCAGHPKLATFGDADLYMHVIDGIARKVDAALDPPEQRRREIGTCELCGTMLAAGAADQWVTCPVCGRSGAGVLQPCLSGREGEKCRFAAAESTAGARRGDPRADGRRCSEDRAAREPAAA